MELHCQGFAFFLTMILITGLVITDGLVSTWPSKHGSAVASESASPAQLKSRN